MEPGWQRNVVVGVVLVLWIAGFGLLAVDDGATFAEGVGNAVWLVAWLLAVIVTDRLIRSLPGRFLALAVSLVAITAVYQLIVDGGATWTAAAWAVTAAAALIIIRLIIDAVSHRISAGRRPTVN